MSRTAVAFSIGLLLSYPSECHDARTNDELVVLRPWSGLRANRATDSAVIFKVGDVH